MSQALVLIVAMASAASAADKTIMLYGDSLLAGYGLAASDGFMEQLQAALNAHRDGIQLVNASVSGDTTTTGLRRLDWAMADRPDAVILALGANDMLMGLPVSQARESLSAILAKLHAQAIPVLLLGMKANRGLGTDYVEAFDRLYPDLSAQYETLLYPFYLDGVALDPSLNQPDMRHPNAEGVGHIVAAVTPFVEQLITRIK